MLKAEITTRPVGPNQVLIEQRLSSQARPVKPPAPLPHILTTTSLPNVNTQSSTTKASTSRFSFKLETGDRLLNLVQGVFLTLNYTNPNKTQECWLCLVSRPPYYEGMAVTGNLTNQTTAPSAYASGPQHKLTLSEVSGQGLCIGTIPSTHQALCNSTQEISPGSYYLTGPNGTYWACNSGLTPCVSAQALNSASDYCVLIELWPKIVYHEPEYIYSHFEGMTRPRREPMSLTLALLLGGLTVGGIAAGVGTGVTALMETSQFRQLQQAMHTDLQALE